MRVTAIGYAFNDIKPMLKEVNASCYYTHNNREAIMGAEAVATAVFLAKKQEEYFYQEDTAHIKYMV